LLAKNALLFGGQLLRSWRKSARISWKNRAEPGSSLPDAIEDMFFPRIAKRDHAEAGNLN